MKERVVARDILSDPVILALKDSLSKALGTSLKELWLFGSRARGDYRPDSDYDVLVVADGVMSDLNEAVSASSYSVLDSYEELVGPVVYTPEIWETIRNSPLGWNVRKEGIQIL